MSAVTRGVVHLVLAVVIGGAAGWGAMEGFSSWRDHQVASDPAQTLPPPGTRVQKAIEGIRADGVHVAPDGRDMVDADGERRVEKAVAASGQPVKVIVWAPSTQGGDWLRVDEQLKREFAGEDALIYVWEGPETGDVIEVGRELDFYEVRQDGKALEYPTDFVGDPASKLTEAVLATKGVGWDDPYEADSTTSLFFAGLTVGILAALGALAVIWAVMFGIQRKSGMRVPGRWRWTGG